MRNRTFYRKNCTYTYIPKKNVIIIKPRRGKTIARQLTNKLTVELDADGVDMGYLLTGNLGWKQALLDMYF